MVYKLSLYTVFSTQKYYDWYKYSNFQLNCLKSTFLVLLGTCFFVWGFLCPCSSLWFERTVFGRKLRNILGENEIVKSFTFRDIVGANTRYNLLNLIFFMDLLVIQ